MAGADLQRSRDGETAVTQVELFFDLVFVFAVTQLSHLLLAHLSWLGAAQTGLLFCAVWWAWIYTGWVTNWLDPDKRPVRLLLFALMALGLVLSAALPRAFGDRGLVFAVAFSAMQLGRTLFMLWALAGRSAGNERNFQRILVWLLLTSALWIAGGLAPSVRLPVWIAAVAVELTAPALGFFVPGMGRSTTADWDVDGGHLAERCSAFILIALGESVTVTGAAFFEARWTPAVSAAFGCAFVGAIALWWTYFDTAAERTSRRVAEIDDPGRIARLAYTYLHAVIVAGVIVWAVADERVLDDPLVRADAATMWVLLGGPALYLAGNGGFRRTLSPRFAPSHTVGLVLLGLIGMGWGVFGASRLLVGMGTALAWSRWPRWVRSYSVGRRRAGRRPERAPTPELKAVRASVGRARLGADPVKETVAGEYAVSSVAPPAGAADRLDGRRLSGRSQIVWGEHCSECAYPACYASCSFYDPRPDLNCRRFAAGIEDAGAGLMRLRLRKWGKLEGHGPARLRPYAQAQRRERLDAVVARAMAEAPLPFQLKRAAAWRLDRAKARPSAAAHLAVDAFVLEGWSNDGRNHGFTITFLQDGAPGGTWQAHLTLGPDYARHVLPIGPIASAIRLDQSYLVQVEPVGEAEGIDVTFALADFVAFRDPADALPAPSVAPAPTVSAASGPTLAKVLVWDLDETLWTGTLAEDGAQGVTPRPEAVAALKTLDARGVLHSIASKNDAAEAQAALKRFGLDDYFLHPQVGWGPKSTSVAAIAAALDLGIDSFVFIDDQPFERAEVAAAHPGVRTLEHTRVADLLGHPWFDHPATLEAGRRRSLYQAEAARGLAAEASGSDYLAFLRASRLALDVRLLDSADITRVHELSQRTNQLNFTGAKFTRPQVEAMAAPDPRHARLTLRCADAWGDYGLIGFADLDLAGGELAAFFMSCRVQRKRVEQAAFAHMAALVAARGHAAFAIRFHATERNGASVRLLEELGFTRAPEGWRRPSAEPFAESDIVELMGVRQAHAA